ncbi:MAG TPA: PilZ domain-containing protein [Syntrophales bacterium]|nr:PilZ domain-containing protein [Syntrophales bacterium]
MEDLVDIRPGMSVNIVLNVDIDKETSDVRNAVVYDVDGKGIVLSQTNPPFTKYHIGIGITITYLLKKKEGPSRIGFSGKVSGIINDYNLYSSETVQAINIVRESELKVYDLRMHYRVSPKSDAGINIYVGDEKVNLLDISLGGARFCHSIDKPIEPGVMIKMILTIDWERFDIEAKSVNVWYPSEIGRRADLEYVSIQFFKMDKKCSHLLSGKILAIQREFLSKT